MGCKQNYIRPLCPTRFTVKFKALCGLKAQIKALQEALEILIEDTSDRKISAHANGFIEKFNQFDFYFNLELSLQIFQVTDNLSTQLQGITISVGQSFNITKLTISQIKNWRNDEQYV